VLLDC